MAFPDPPQPLSCPHPCLTSVFRVTEAEPLKVLVIDQNTTETTLVNTTLGREGYEVATATSLDEGLSVFRGSRFDLLLLANDTQWDNLGEWWERARGAFADVPIILLGENDGRVPASASVQLPINTEELMDEVRAQLGPASQGTLTWLPESLKEETAEIAEMEAMLGWRTPTTTTAAPVQDTPGDPEETHAPALAQGEDTALETESGPNLDTEDSGNELADMMASLERFMEEELPEAVAETMSGEFAVAGGTDLTSETRDSSEVTVDASAESTPLDTEQPEAIAESPQPESDEAEVLTAEEDSATTATEAGVVADGMDEITISEASDGELEPAIALDGDGTETEAEVLEEGLHFELDTPAPDPVEPVAEEEPAVTALVSPVPGADPDILPGQVAGLPLARVEEIIADVAREVIERVVWDTVPHMVAQALSQNRAEQDKLFTQIVERAVWETLPEIATSKVQAEIERISEGD